MPLKGEEYTISKDSLKAYEKLDRKLLGSDLILMLLSIHNIKGNTKLQKQVFLTWKELFIDVTHDPTFFPWKYGAFSKVVEDSASILTKQGYVRRAKRKGEGTIYSITDIGREKIKNKLDEIGVELGKLEKKKADWDEWSTKGIMKYVYRNYPQYTSKTEVPSLKW